MKIKDLSPDKNIFGVAFIHPETGERCLFRSMWPKGVWFQKDAESDQVFQLFIEKQEDVLELEIAP